MLTKNFIIPALAGRLGNNLFMIAHAYAMGLEYNRQVVIAKDQVKYEGNDFSQNIFRKLEMIEKFYPQRFTGLVPAEDEPTMCVGYYQSEEYFKKYSENIKSLFGPPLEFIKGNKNLITELFSTRTLVINVRRGDYLHYPNYHPTITPEYIEKALSIIPLIEHIIVLSDDISWCKIALDIIHSTQITYIEGFPPEVQLWLMSMGNDYIISNSSFSWWGAWLSREPNKTVVAPATWFGPDYQGTWDNIYANGWTILPTKFKDGFIYPL